MSELENILGINFKKGTKILEATNSSKKVKKGSIFFGLPGVKEHGSKYSEDALNMGASLVVHNDSNAHINNDDIFYIKDLEDRIVNFLNALYDIDISNNNFFGFTGTNGKSSAAYLCHQLLINFGYESLYVGTLGIQFNQNKYNKTFSTKTTPDIFELFDILNNNKFEDAGNICIEISSHALDQKRLSNIGWFNSTSILNITSDHLDYHKDIASYRDTKFEIYKMQSSIKLIDEDSSKYKDDYDFVQNDEYKLTTISNKNNFSDIFFRITEMSPHKSFFYVSVNEPPNVYQSIKKKKYKFSCNLFPEFNIHNLIFSICSIGFDKFEENIINDLSFLNLPKGRCEVIRDIPSNVIIDYAHNPEAIDNFLSSIRDYYKNLVVVFGCGGDRDKSKRTKMLKAAIKSSSKVIFTSDNSRSEDFENIFTDAAHNNNIEDVVKIKDRKEAIIHASKILPNNGCLVILGKGHEETQEEKNKTNFFSDHEVINEIYK
jgi:UDP-N-acetylmuramoyl-L-alanyl-D-glutamate--2,6-diaminopimelate ligase